MEQNRSQKKFQTWIETLHTTELTPQVDKKSIDHSKVDTRKIRCTYGEKIVFLPHTNRNNQF